VLHIITTTGDGLFRFVSIDDLERPWTPFPHPKKGVWWLFFAIFGCSAHFNSKLQWNGWRWIKTTYTWNF